MTAALFNLTSACVNDTWTHFIPLNVIYMNFGVSLSFPPPVKVWLLFSFCCQIRPFLCLSSWFFSLVVSLWVRGFHQSPSGFPVSLQLSVLLFFRSLVIQLTLVSTATSQPGLQFLAPEPVFLHHLFFVFLWHSHSESFKKLFLLTWDN